MPRAPRRCPGDQHHCPNMVTDTPYCPDHTIPWRGPRSASSRIVSKRVWKAKVTPFVIQRANGRCQIGYPGICLGRATIADKIIPAARRPDLAMEPSNWQAACAPCNARKGRTEDRKRR